MPPPSSGQALFSIFLLTSSIYLPPFYFLTYIRILLRQDSLPAAGCASNIIPLRRSAIPRRVFVQGTLFPVRKKSLQCAGLVNCWFCCASQKKDSHRLLIVFSAGIRLVTKRGRVWEGGNGEKGYPQKGIVAPRWKALLSPFPVLAPLPFPVQLQCLYNRIFHLFRRRPR